MIRQTTTIAAAVALALAAPAAADSAAKTDATLDLGSLRKLGTVDERFQSYNIEMAEVTGGRFWARYGDASGQMFLPQPAIDLADPRLVAMAEQLGPAFVRISGTWANGTYLPAAGENISAPPKGFEKLLTRAQWRGVVAFSKAVDAKIVTSFAVGGGTRGADGVWKPDQAQRLLDLTREAGGAIVAAEFFNEPNVSAGTMGMPKGYTAQDYAAEFRIFRDWARRAAPEMKILGPGGLGEGGVIKDVPAAAMGGSHIATRDMMAANPGSVDAVSYHFYGAVSSRCAAQKIRIATKEEALSPEWLDLTLRDYAYYAKLRDAYEPGKPMWNTETAQAACGGSPWASTFRDSFRYLNQLGLLAQQGVQVVIHNTLAASDYALIDGRTMTPRPDYWAAVMWKRTMGRVVLAAPASPSPDLRIYAQCLPTMNGGVGVTMLNTGSAPRTLPFARGARAWVMTGSLDTRSIAINSRAPGFDKAGNVTGVTSAAVRGSLTIPAQAIAFVAVAGAGNAACR